MFNFLASQIPGPIFCTPAILGHASVTSMSIGNLQYILLHDIHNLLCDLILKHESTSPEFVWGFQCSLLGSKIHYLGQEKLNSSHGSTQVVNIHYLGQIHNLGQNISITITSNKLACNKLVADSAPLLVEVYYIYKLKLIYLYFYLLPDNRLVLNM